ncbi:hypothetical protein OJAV_G00230220 [Oryzias javanicus]|uniref:Uncharacterized protein n=1 Tax=Oryzias javanicus TaxID=123683 RepID=A0A3S2NTA3_ORYJA|nr:hypothetical protein OJAV_G00230220 [Oryzias javanicus]
MCHQRSSGPNIHPGVSRFSPAHLTLFQLLFLGETALAAPHIQTPARCRAPPSLSSPQEFRLSPPHLKGY